MPLLCSPCSTLGLWHGHQTNCQRASERETKAETVGLVVVVVVGWPLTSELRKQSAEAAPLRRLVVVAAAAAIGP